MDFVLKIKILLFLLGMMNFCHSFNSYSGAAFSPYTKRNVNHDKYSYEDVKAQLKTVGSKFKWISSYSMGVNEWNKNGAWDKADANCLIAKAAADLNKNNNANLKVSIGVYQNKDQSILNKEIENAFKAGKDANGRSPGTVWGIVFTNEYFKENDKAKANQVLEMIKKNKKKGFKVGTRTDFCGHIQKPSTPIQPVLVKIAKESDFIMCNMYPNESDCKAQDGVKKSIAAIGKSFNEVKNKFRSINPGLEVMIGETGWASEGPTFNNCPNNVNNLKNFWRGMANWGQQNKVKIHFFEGIDEPWKPNLEGEKHFGWWYRDGNQSPPKLVEKAK